MLIELIITLIGALLSVAFLTVSERNVMASIQRRRGPNIVGAYGLLQAVADGAKLIFKDIIIPIRANPVLFMAAPSLALLISLVIWIFIPFSGTNYLTNFDLSLLFIYAVSSIGVYGIIWAGWSSNSKYAFLGSLRSSAQLISYEVSMNLLLLPVAACSNSFNLLEIVATQEKTIWYFIPLLPVFVVFFISVLAETNRAPFDLPEAEAEIVAGYNIEYSAMTFALFFLAEYNNILWLSFVLSICFLGGWLFPFGLLPSSVLWLVFKACFICFIIIKVRANYPRYRYDQLMRLGWKVFLPTSLGYLILTIGMFISF